jgi:NAD(P)-dependent dehydrogenase (short-subunit alcohol dehydrogenase family)
MKNAVALGARGIRINCTGPGVTETPILDQLRAKYGQEYLDSFPTPLGRVSNPTEQAAVLAFLGSPAAGFITGQVVWVDGGNLASRVAATMEGSALWPA